MIVEAGESEIHKADRQAGNSCKSYWCSLESKICEAGQKTGNSGRIFMLQP